MRSLAAVEWSLSFLARRQGVVYIGVLAAFFVFISGVSIHELEPDRAPTVWEGMWWAIVTLTTVVYGDISPATFEGRILAAFLMVSGLAVIGALAGSVGALSLGSEEGPSDTDRRLDVMQRELHEIRDLLDPPRMAQQVPCGSNTERLSSGPRAPDAGGISHADAFAARI